ncbi:hypothetical protein CTI12_AA282670 [Artemisia annua]|uniref:Uncharacterized protein n=1 Tax=Artemisia annua TaxID=35608 RepID=A0A2U1NCB4_ARTAN|nr:hypothetical protein CTI12_AA282670 [Artemisia annua]
MRLWGILIFAIIGATATTFAVAQMRRSAEWFSSQYSTSHSSFKGATGGSSRSSFKDEARRRYGRRLKEEYEEELERVERIRRMQRIFNRERNKHRRGYERWREDTSAEYHFYNHFHQDDWYWKTDTTYGSWSNYREPHQTPANYSLSHHYAVLGLSRLHKCGGVQNGFPLSTSHSSFKGATGGSSRSSFKDEARRRYGRRLKEEYEEELERVERIRRMQRIFNRERNKHRRGYERWREDTSAEYHFYNHFHQDDWYWKTDTTYGSWSNYREPHQTPANYSLSHHYAVLGLSSRKALLILDRGHMWILRYVLLSTIFSDVAEARFKEVMTSYEAIKSERKNMN